MVWTFWWIWMILGLVICILGIVSYTSDIFGIKVDTEDPDDSYGTLDDSEDGETILDGVVSTIADSIPWQEYVWQGVSWGMVGIGAILTGVSIYKVVRIQYAANQATPTAAPTAT